MRPDLVLHPLSPLGALPAGRIRRAPILLVGGAVMLLGSLLVLPRQADAAEPAASEKQAPERTTKKAQKTGPSRTPAATKKGSGAAEAPKSSAKPVRPQRARPRVLVPAATATALPFAAQALSVSSGPNPSTEFEQGPGVLGVSLSTSRRDQLKEFPSEQVGRIALVLDDLRFAPVNKKTHVEVNLLDRIPFEGKGDQLGVKARRALDALGRMFVDNPETRIQMLVHTNDQGDAGYNLRLSQRAAEAVKAYLVGRGVAAERLIPIGRGEEAPLINTGKRTPTQRERLRNQRVELIIEPLPASPGAPVPQSPAPPIGSSAEATITPPRGPIDRATDRPRDRAGAIAPPGSRNGATPPTAPVTTPEPTLPPRPAGPLAPPAPSRSSPPTAPRYP